MSGIFRSLLAIPVYLAITPLVARSLGPEEFGVWSFGSMLVNVFAFTDFGLKSSLTYHIARGRDSREEVVSCFNAVFWSYSAIALAVLAVTVGLASGFSCQLLNVPTHLESEAAYVLSIFAAGFGVRFIAVAYQGIVDGYQEQSFTQKVFTCWLLVNAAGTVIAVTVFSGLHALGVVSLIGNFMVFVAFYLRIRLHYPFVRVRFQSISFAALRRLLKFGGGVFVASMVIALREPFLKILVSHRYGLPAVADFEVVLRLCSQVMAVIVSPLGGVFAASAYLSDNREELSDLVRSLFSASLAAFLPIIIFGIAFGEALVTWWLGEQYAGAGKLLPGILTAFAVYYMTEVLYKSMEGSGHSRYSAIVQTVSLVFGTGAFFLSDGGMVRTLVSAYLVGFVTFSLMNGFYFLKRFPGKRLIGATELLCFGVPFGLFLATVPMVSVSMLAPLFGVYLGVHLCMVQMTGAVDLIRLGKSIVGAVGGKQP
ncbi:hypothetical protein RW64_16670 [Geobacter sulfurreducens]|nr:hypothetical protein RW64_16670 [Geobacter sulfurreducens]